MDYFVKKINITRFDPNSLADKEGLLPSTYARILIIKGIRDRAA